VIVQYSAEEKESFVNDPEKYASYRRHIESTFLKLHTSLIRGSEANKRGSQMVENLVREKLASRPDIFARIKPEYPVGCKRLGAGPGYLEALCKDNVLLVTCGIKKVVTDGIIDAEGVFRPADAIMCATGFDAYDHPFQAQTLL
jgi:cation diffusion facilitator CzcD-associated flavoprotein CzcO